MLVSMVAASAASAAAASPTSAPPSSILNLFKFDFFTTISPVGKNLPFLLNFGFNITTSPSSISSSSSSPLDVKKNFTS